MHKKRAPLLAFSLHTETVSETNSHLGNLERASISVRRDTRHSLNRIVMRMENIQDKITKQFDEIKEMLRELQEQLLPTSRHKQDDPEPVSIAQGIGVNEGSLTDGENDSVELTDSIERLCKLTKSFDTAESCEEMQSIIKDLEELLYIASGQLRRRSSSGSLGTTEQENFKRIKGLLDSSVSVLINHEGKL